MPLAEMVVDLSAFIQGEGWCKKRKHANRNKIKTMRKICLALCISLFASIIHAGVMPFEFMTQESQHQSTTIDTSVHSCEEVTSNTQDKNNNQLCHSDSYQCCLGLVVIPVLSDDLLPTSAQSLPTLYSTLALQPMINFIYKPPKAAI